MVILVCVLLEVACMRVVRRLEVAAAPASRVASVAGSDAATETDDDLPEMQYCRSKSCSACAVKRAAEAGLCSLGDVTPDAHDDPAFA